MAIDEGNRDLPDGTRLAANYKGTRYVCLVGRNEEDKPTYTLEHSGETFTSPSRAGTQVMGGSTACNGWRFWTLESDLKERAERQPATEKKAKEPKPAKAEKPPKRSAKAKPVIITVRNKKGAAEGQARYMCTECGEPFFDKELSKGQVPEQCPEGHLAFTDEDGNVQYAKSEAVEDEETESAEIESAEIESEAPEEGGIFEEVGEPEPVL